MKKYLALLSSTRNNNSSDLKAIKRINEIHKKLQGNPDLPSTEAKELVIETLKLKKTPQFEIDSLLESPTHLFCFPYAGGSASLYDKWSSINNEKIKVTPLEYPGRGAKAKENLIPSFGSLLKYLEKELVPILPTSGSFALFGHSLGALIALELSFLLKTKYNLTPSILFLSGCPPPNITSSLQSIHKVNDQNFMQILQELNGTPKSLLETDAFVTFFLPIIKNDFSLLNSYQYSEEKLSIPLTILGGREDPYAKPEDLKKWKEWTDKNVSFYQVDGDHFFIHQSDEIVKIIKESLCPLTS